MLIQLYSAVRSYERLFESGQPVDYETIHLLRIDCKYLRYSLEFFEHLCDQHAKPLIKKLKHLQDHLGELNDAVVGAEMLEQRIDGTSKIEASTVQRQIKHQQEIIEKLILEVPSELQRFTATEMRQHLGMAIAAM